MDDFSVLEEIGLKEVSNRTHIEVKNLEYIINSEFDKLNKASAIGFVKILSREYGLDLTDWLNEAQKFWGENKIGENTQKIFIAQKEKKSSKSIFVVLALFVLVAILYGAYIFLNNKLDFFENPLVKTDTNYTYEETPVVSEAKETLEENVTQNETNDTMVMDMNQSVDAAVDMQTDTEDKNDSNSSFESAPKKVLATSADKNVTNTNVVAKRDDYISPNAKLWLGVIYLDNFKRKSFLGKSNFKLDASRDQLITTGHGNFTLYFNGEVKKFHSQNPIRLLIKDGKFSMISDKRFKELNRGSIW